MALDLLMFVTVAGKPLVSAVGDVNTCSAKEEVVFERCDSPAIDVDEDKLIMDGSVDNGDLSNLDDSLLDQDDNKSVPPMKSEFGTAVTKESDDSSKAGQTPTDRIPEILKSDPDQGVEVQDITAESSGDVNLFAKNDDEDIEAKGVDSKGIAELDKTKTSVEESTVEGLAVELVGKDNKEDCKKEGDPDNKLHCTERQEAEVRDSAAKLKGGKWNEEKGKTGNKAEEFEVGQDVKDHEVSTNDEDAESKLLPSSAPGIDRDASRNPSSSRDAGSAHGNVFLQPLASADEQEKLSIEKRLECDLSEPMDTQETVTDLQDTLPTENGSNNQAQKPKEPSTDRRITHMNMNSAASTLCEETVKKDGENAKEGANKMDVVPEVMDTTHGSVAETAAPIVIDEPTPDSTDKEETAAEVITVDDDTEPSDDSKMEEDRVAEDVQNVGTDAASDSKDSRDTTADGPSEPGVVVEKKAVGIISQGQLKEPETRDLKPGDSDTLSKTNVDEKLETKVEIKEESTAEPGAEPCGETWSKTQDSLIKEETPLDVCSELDSDTAVKAESSLQMEQGVDEQSVATSRKRSPPPSPSTRTTNVKRSRLDAVIGRLGSQVTAKSQENCRTEPKVSSLSPAPSASESDGEFDESGPIIRISAKVIVVAPVLNAGTCSRCFETFWCLHREACVHIPGAFASFQKLNRLIDKRMIQYVQVTHGKLIRQLQSQIEELQASRDAWKATAKELHKQVVEASALSPGSNRRRSSSSQKVGFSIFLPPSHIPARNEMPLCGTEIVK